MPEYKTDFLGNKYTDHVGFHEDQYCVRVIDDLVKIMGSRVFVETGSYYGCSLEYMTANYELDRCYSCEPESNHYDRTINRITEGGYTGVSVFKTVSQSMLNEIIAKHKDETDETDLNNGIFYLDAHGYGFDWPLRDEVELVTSNIEGGYIIIDDFQIPNQPHFGYDSYQGQICNFEYIRHQIKSDYKLFYPHYTENTTNCKAPR